MGSQSKKGQTVFFDKGNYRMLNRAGVSKGEWYYTVNCEKCSTPVCYAKNNQGAAGIVPFAGLGKISTPCFECGHDGFYPVINIYNHRAEKSYAGSRPKRVNPSKAKRQPLWRKHPKAKPTFGVGLVEDRPAAAAIIARIITSWADIEVQFAHLLSQMMKTNIKPVAAVFSSMRSSRVQHDALNAVAKVTLGEESKDYELFCAYMIRRKELEEERNDLAHGCLGISHKFPEDILWTSQADRIQQIAMHAEFGQNDETDKLTRKQTFVYTVGALERIAQEIEEFHNQISSFTGYRSASGSEDGEKFRAIRYHQLCNQPHIQQALARIRASKNKTSTQKKSRPSKLGSKRK